MKQAVQVDIKSIGGAFDNAAYQVVLALVGNIVAQGGGGKVCGPSNR